MKYIKFYNQLNKDLQREEKKFSIIQLLFRMFKYIHYV